MEHTELRAVIGVWHRGASTYYVKRSRRMQYYPNVWSLPSFRYDSHVLRDPENLTDARTLIQEMSDQRLGGVPILAVDHLISGDSDKNPYGLHVYLNLYRIKLAAEPVLNPIYYEEGAWLSAQEYEDKSAGQECGLCLRLWSDYAWLARITDRPFVAQRYHGRW